MTLIVEPDAMGNKLLSALPMGERDRLCEKLQRVELPFRKVVHEAGTPSRYVYFPIDCVLSKQFATTSGGVSEVASVGSEGLIGTPLLLGCAGSPIRTVVEVAGSAWRGNGAVMRAEFVHSAQVRDLVLRHAQALIIQMGQNAACYQHHAVEQQFCRWLLLTSDRAHSSRLRLTQELIAQTIGVRREGINDIVGRLTRRGLLRKTRGTIELLDRDGLERACCDCYGTITREYARLLPEARIARRTHDRGRAPAA